MAGYIGSKASVVSSGAERKKVFNITGATTSLTGCNYTVGKVQVFQNGVRLLDGTDYTATDGTTVTLTVAAQSGDNVVVLSQASFQVADAVLTSGGTITGDLTVQGAFTSQGIDDNANATALTIDSSERVMIGKTSTSFSTAGHRIDPDGNVEHIRDSNPPLNLNRKSTDGDIALFYKDGTTVGSIGSVSGVDLFIAGNRGAGQRYLLDNILPCNSTGAVNNGDIDLGTADYKYRDLFLGGGIHLGGGGSANKLDDYEEGTWTASFSGTTATNIGNTTGYYTKIGNTVHFSYYTGEVDLANAVTGGARINGLPFNSSNSTQRYGLFLTSYGNAIQNESNGGFVAKGSNYLVFMIQESNAETTWYNGTNKRIMVAGTYMVD